MGLAKFVVAVEYTYGNGYKVAEWHVDSEEQALKIRNTVNVLLLPICTALPRWTVAPVELGPWRDL